MRFKKSQQSIGMSFSTIFSIFLIIFFVFIAFLVIKYFLGFQKCTQISLFVNDLQNEIDSAWNSEKSEFNFNTNLPSNIKQVCFANLSNPKSNSNQEIYQDMIFYKETNANLFFYPSINACDIPYHNIKNINLEEITKNQNPYCIEVVKGKILLKIQKDRGDYLVKIS